MDHNQRRRCSTTRASFATPTGPRTRARTPSPSATADEAAWPTPPERANPTSGGGRECPACASAASILSADPTAADPASSGGSRTTSQPPAWRETSNRPSRPNTWRHARDGTRRRRALGMGTSGGSRHPGPRAGYTPVAVNNRPPASDVVSGVVGDVPSEVRGGFQRDAFKLDRSARSKAFRGDAQSAGGRGLQTLTRPLERRVQRVRARRGGGGGGAPRRRRGMGTGEETRRGTRDAAARPWRRTNSGKELRKMRVQGVHA